jgi:hypothetical protein
MSGTVLGSISRARPAGPCGYCDPLAGEVRGSAAVQGGDWLMAPVSLVEVTSVAYASNGTV